MPDTDVWALGGPIASPAGTDRVPVATTSGAGGYSSRSEFVYRDAGGEYKMTETQFPRLVFERAGVGTWSLGYDGTPGSNSFALRLNGGAPSLIVQTGGSVGIGTTSPSNSLGYDKTLSLSGSYPAFTIQGTAGSGRKYGFGTDTVGAFHLFDDGAGAKRLTVLSNGNIGINQESPSTRLHVKAAGEIAILETTAARGSGNGYLSIYDPTGRKCYIGYGTFSDTLTVVNELNGPITFGTNGNYRWSIGSAGAFEPVTDNAYNIGHASFRIKDTYLVNSPTVTSDATEKEWLGAGFSPAELSAAKRIAAEVGSYKWLAAIAHENDGGPAARIHFGVRAQAVWAIMADEGLIDPIEEGVTPSCPYGFLCWDAVEDNPNGRFGIRIEQLALFLIAAQEARLAAIEAALSEGE